MITRKYFYSVKVAHNDDTGNYSWHHSVVTITSWFADLDELMIDIRRQSANVLRPRLERPIKEQDIEIVSLNRV